MPWEDAYPPERLVAPDPGWSERFADLSTSLHASLGNDWQVEHVGSTSVPGLTAKPVIDLALGAPSRVSLRATHGAFAAAGWTHPVEVGDHLATFLLDGSVRRSIGHVYTAEQWPTAHVRLFADWLRRHEVDRDRYAALKVGLVATGSWGEAYTPGKSHFVLDVVNRARAARGLPSVDVL